MTRPDISRVQALLDDRLAEDRHLSLAKREQLLKRLKQMLIEQEDVFLQSLQADLHKSAVEAYTSELAVVLNEIDYVLAHLKRWLKPDRSYHVKLGFIEKIESVRQPYGTVLVLSPWNYPLQLALMPVVSALAAGNACVIKPSELAPQTSAALTEAIADYFSPSQVLAVTGDASMAQALIALQFDLIFFTGGQTTGQKVYRQAAEQLTPVVLELGGKNPCVMDETGFSEQAIQEIVWGKFLNAGQTCIAPDTLFVPESLYDQTLALLKKVIIDFYGHQAGSSPDYGRLIHTRHLDRLRDCLTEGTIYYGGEVDRDQLLLTPTILTDLPRDAAVRSEEIFGPILPVIPYTDLESLVKGTELQKDGLVAYVFSTDDRTIQLAQQEMKSTVSVNQVIHHAANPHVPFGGIGRSGFGVSHGKAGFAECSFEQTYYRAYHYKHLSQKYPGAPTQNLGLIKRFRKWLF
ncbi:aldehyde dehydrogenase [Barrientosiimonas marina]|uniref:Aldehyde dehydrogenase n=1 Tax=Lentibacillus kimchii TaxID=1542911 RepID=A0ABW2UW32_9BACI